MSFRCCQIRYIQHWLCSTSCIHISSCHPGSETANSCCTCNTNTTTNSTLQTPHKALPVVCSPQKHRCHPLEVPQARLAQPLLSYTNQLEAGRYQSRLMMMIMIMQIYIAQFIYYLLCFTYVLLRPCLHTVSFLIEGEPSPPRSTPWGAYRLAISHEAVPLYLLACSMQHSLTHGR